MEIKSLIESIKDDYPFPQIFEETSDTILNLMSVVESEVPKGGNILDIGAGALDKVAVLQKAGYQCFACDDFQDPWHKNEDHIKPIYQYASKNGIQVHKQTDGYAIPWETSSFDAVIMVNVIEHLHQSPRDILNFAGTYLKDGGLLVIIMPNSVNLRKRISVVTGRTNYTPVRGFFENEGAWRGHVREFTLQETTSIIEWSKFQLVCNKTFHGLLHQRLRQSYLRLVFVAICKIFPNFRDSLLVAGTKPEGWVSRQSDESSLDKSLTDSWLA